MPERMRWNRRKKYKRGDQPQWKFIANTGDANPLDYGGIFVYVDETGVYDPEMEVLFLDDEEEEETTYTVHRVSLERLKWVDGFLVPHAYSRTDCPHPIARYEPWFRDKLKEIASSVGVDPRDLENAFASADPLELARAYEALGSYFGWTELDHDPPAGLSMEGVKARYTDGELGRQA